MTPNRFVLLLAIAAALVGAGSQALAVCGPFTDVSDASFCPFVLEIFTLGITTGTTPTTYEPGGHASRLQMAAFLSRSVDGILRRGSRRALVKKFWTPQSGQVLGVTTLGGDPTMLQSDGRDVWVSRFIPDDVVRVRGSDGKLLETWTGAVAARGVLVAAGSILVAGNTTPGRLYRIDPSLPAGSVTTVASNLGGGPYGIAFDGMRIWTANQGSVSIVTPGASIPWSVTTIAIGSLEGIVYDGASIWIADFVGGTLRKLDGSGAVLQTVTIGDGPTNPVFDGTNIWAPNYVDNSISVVRASSGAVLGTLTGNGLALPRTAAFDGQRVLAVNYGGDSVSLWKAADLTPLGSLSLSATTSSPFGSCSDGVNFWITLAGSGLLLRF